MAEDPRFILHFKTLAKFKLKLADGTVSENRHLVFIKDEKLLWCRGVYYADASKLDNFNSYYNDWSITQSDINTITITLKGNKWNSTTRKWEAISKPLILNAATGAIAGLMSALDKRLVDIIDTANFLFADPTTNATLVTINATHTNVNSETRNLKTSKTLTSATSTNAGILTALDKRQLDIINSANFELTTPSTTATTVVLHTKRTNVNEEANDIADTEAAIARTLPAATLTKAGVMIALDKLKEDRITGVNYSISNPESTATTRVIKITGLNPNNNTSIGSEITLPSATLTLSGLLNTTDKLAIDNLKTLSSFSHINDDSTFTRTANDVNLNYSCKSVSESSTQAATVHSLPIGAATLSLAGVMLASDKTKLDRISTTDFNLGTPTTTATSVTINATKKTPSTNAVSNNNINIPLATRTTAGVITNVEKLYLDAINTLGAITHLKHSDTGGITRDATNVYLNYTCIGKSDTAINNRSLTIPAATTTSAGVISSTEKKKLDNITVVDVGTNNTAGISKINLASGSTDTASILTETGNDSTKVIVEINDNFGTNEVDVFLVRGTESTSISNPTNNIRFQVGKTIQARSKNNVLERVLTATDLSDGSVTKVGTATIGSSTSPVYLNAGIPTACSLDNRYYTETEIDGKVNTINNTISTNKNAVDSHIANKSNPHSVTKALVGLGDVTNESKATMFTSPVFTGTPTAPTAAAGTNTTQIATTAFVQKATTDTVTKIVAGADASFDTLKEISDWIGTHTDSAAAMNSLITTNKNNISNIQTKLNGIASGAEVNVQSDWNVTDTSSDAYIKNKPGVATTSANGFMSAADKTKLNGIATGANAYSLPLASSSTRGGVKIGYTANGKNYPVLLSNEQMYVNVPWSNTTYSNATTTAAGLMSAADKAKLDGVATGANNYVLPNTVAHKNVANTWTAYLDFTAGAGNSGSDMRFKENVKPINSIINDILDIEVLSYIWNKNGESTRDTFGVNANLLLEKGGLFAKMVHERMDKEKTKWVEYERFGVLAIKAILELFEYTSAYIRTLNEDIYNLRKELNELKYK